MRPTENKVPMTCLATAAATISTVAAAKDLFGGKGDDDIEGGTGDDKLSGGSGDDDFIFDTNFGDDIVKKFLTGHDLIDLSGTGLTFEDLDIHKKGGDTVVDCDEGTITIGKVVGNLHESDFVF